MKKYNRNECNDFQVSFLSTNQEDFKNFLEPILTCISQDISLFTSVNDFSFKRPFSFLQKFFCPMSCINRSFNTKYWNSRGIVKRQKVAAKALFFEKIKTLLPHPKKIELDSNLDSFTIWKQKLWKIWHEGDLNFKMDNFKSSLKIEASMNFEIFSKAITKPAPYTNKWSRPPGINHILINPGVKSFYIFKDGSKIFPINFSGKSSEDFFNRDFIPDGTILNPPFSGGILDRILSRLIKLTNLQRTTCAVILPFWTTTTWFKLLTHLNYPVFNLGKVAYRRGRLSEYQNIANFETCIILIGAFSTKSFFNIKTDDLGYPLEFDYLKSFSKIKFPANLDTNLCPDPQAFDKNKINLLVQLLEWAERWDTSFTGDDITKEFEIEETLINNFALQNVNFGLINPCSHKNSFRIAEIYKYRFNPENFKMKNRTLFSRHNFNTWLENFKIFPTEKFRTTRCTICKKLGHLISHCPFKIPSKAELGLIHFGEILLYNFIKIYHKEYTKANKVEKISWTNSNLASRWLIKARQQEIIFWEKFKLFALKKGYKNFQNLLRFNEFSKSRHAIGFNLVTGAPLYELITDAFGAVIHLYNPPPPCIFLPDISKPEKMFEISDNIMTEDEKEINRGTQIILPCQNIRYILPRFQVKNSDTTERVINDCRLLGPYTPIIHYRLPRPSNLQKFHEEDIILSVDGKSAYKQRKLAPSCQNLIGFQTKVDNKPCYVSMTTPPFGLHNAGFIYQDILENKIGRIAGSLPFIEYVDDVLIKVGTIHEDRTIVENRIKFFITLLTASGEIINNKIKIFSQRITMMGSKFYLGTRRFTPKLNSAFKLGLKLLDICTKPNITLLDIQKIAGSANWLLQGKKPPSILDLNFTVSRLLKGIDMQKAHHRRIAAGRSIPLTRQFLDIIFHVLTEIYYTYSQIRKPLSYCFSENLCIIVDSNPQIGGGFIFWERNFLHFQNTEQIFTEKEKVFPTHFIPQKYLKKFKLEGVVTSYSAELLGLYNYLRLVEDFLKENHDQYKNLKIFIDNLGLISTLEKLNPKQAHTTRLHQEVHAFLQKLDKHFSFHWLRRSNSFIAKADALGRFTTPTFYLSGNLNSKLRKFFNKVFFIPEIFHNIDNLTQFLHPKFLNTKKNCCPMLLLHPRTQITKIEFILVALANTSVKVLVGFPLRRKYLIEQYCQSDNIFKVDSINTENFLGKDINNVKTNMPFIFSFIKSAPFFSA